MISEYRHTRRVQFYETDAAGIVHFSWYPRYMEEAEHAMWRAVGLSIHDEHSAVGWPRVAIALDYLAPLRFEDEFDVVIRVAEINPRSMRYECELSKGAAQVARGSMTIVCVERRPEGTVKAVPIPADIAARFQVAPALA